MKKQKYLFPIIIAALLSGCSLLKEDKAAPLPGERQSLLPSQKNIDLDPAAAKKDLQMPADSENRDWMQSAYLPSHDGVNLSLNQNIKEVWRAPVGEGQDYRHYLLATPIVANDQVYTMDSKGVVSAFAIADGKRMWRVSILPKTDNGENPAGGLAFYDGHLFATNGRRDVMALDSKNGGKIWKIELPGAARIAPTILDGRVYVVTLDNMLVVLDEKTGKELWRHSGISEAASVLGGSSPAVDGDTVIVTYTSGEIFALRPENGMTAWSDSLTTRKSGNMAELSDIRGNAVIGQDLIIAASFGGKIAALDRRSGERVWQQTIGSGQTPLVIGQWIFVTTPNAELIALDRTSGGVRWRTQLDRYIDPEDKDEPVTWAGPVMANGQLWCYGSNGKLIAAEPDQGKIITTIKSEKGAGLSPIVAQKTLFVLSEKGNLIAYK